MGFDAARYWQYFICSYLNPLNNGRHLKKLYPTLKILLSTGLSTAWQRQRFSGCLQGFMGVVAAVFECLGWGGGLLLQPLASLQADSRQPGTRGGLAGLAFQQSVSFSVYLCCGHVGVGLFQGYQQIQAHPVILYRQRRALPAPLLGLRPLLGLSRPDLE